MTQAAHRYAGYRIQVAIIVLIKQPCALSPFEGYGQASVSWHNVASHRFRL